MNPRDRSFYRKISYLVAMAVLLAVMFFFSRPTTQDARGAKGSEGGLLARMRTEHGLSQAQLGEIDPTSESIRLATLGMRGIAANLLWSRANDYKMKKDWTNLSATLNQLVKLQPNFISVWRFQAWNLSYNVS
ncbi:MAG: IRE (iron responsive element), partial [Patescibacteria group bacterium]|nr:IRE (iron responsive element) [Patescibacteria group bacterium]